MKTRLKVLILISSLIGIALGYSIGLSQAYSTCVNLGTRMLNITFRPEFITDFPKIIQYLK